MEKILISACLLGAPVRYNRKDARVESNLLALWQQEGRVLSFCPEQQGGLSTPRPAAEIVGGDGRNVLERKAKVLDQDQTDYTDAFLKGAYAALRICQRYEVKMAILKAESPSCGNQHIYDGSFTGHKKAGMGVTAALLEQYQIRVFNETELLAASKWLKSLGTETILRHGNSE